MNNLTSWEIEALDSELCNFCPNHWTTSMTISGVLYHVCSEHGGEPKTPEIQEAVQY